MQRIEQETFHPINDPYHIWHRKFLCYSIQKQVSRTLGYEEGWHVAAEKSQHLRSTRVQYIFPIHPAHHLSDP